MTETERPYDPDVTPDDPRRPPGEDPEGRPTGAPDGDGLRPGQDLQRAPTEAPEEHGADVPTEHAPGGDL